jgi:hypothetical protein
MASRCVLGSGEDRVAVGRGNANRYSTQLTPFVTNNMSRTYGSYEGSQLGPKDPVTYLARWKAENGLD